MSGRSVKSLKAVSIAELGVSLDRSGNSESQPKGCIASGTERMSTRCC